VSPSVFFTFSPQRHKQCWLGCVVVVGGVWGEFGGVVLFVFWGFVFSKYNIVS